MPSHQNAFGSSFAPSCYRCHVHVPFVYHAAYHTRHDGVPSGESFRHVCHFHHGCWLVGYTPVCEYVPKSAVLHYEYADEPNAWERQVGNVYLFDRSAGAAYFGYGSYMTCSFPINGGFETREQCKHSLGGIECMYCCLCIKSRVCRSWIAAREPCLSFSRSLLSATRRSIEKVDMGLWFSEGSG